MPPITFHFALAFTAALGCGLMAGLFFIFSFCIMRALAQRPAAEGIAAMQAINIAIINPPFYLVFFGTAALSALAVVVALSGWTHPASVYLLAGGILYLIGGLLVTMTCNVPRNNALAATDPTTPEAATLWADYLIQWTAWNHLRTFASLAATAAFILAVSY